MGCVTSTHKMSTTTDESASHYFTHDEELKGKTDLQQKWGQAASEESLAAAVAVRRECVHVCVCVCASCGCVLHL
jgi:hypothetical protein